MTSRYFATYHDRLYGITKEFTGSDLEDVVGPMLYKIEQLEALNTETYAAIYDMSRPEGDRMIATLTHDGKTGTLSLCTDNIFASQLQKMGIKYELTHDPYRVILGSWEITETADLSL